MVILDVLHYIGREEQLLVLKRVRAALPARGLLLLRIGDADGGLRFRYSQWVDKLVMLFRGHASMATHCRSADQWRNLLSECGFDVQANADEPGHALRQCADDCTREMTINGDRPAIDWQRAGLGSARYTTALVSLSE